MWIHNQQLKSRYQHRYMCGDTSYTWMYVCVCVYYWVWFTAVKSRSPFLWCFFFICVCSKHGVNKTLQEAEAQGEWSWRNPFSADCASPPPLGWAINFKLFYLGLLLRISSLRRWGCVTKTAGVDRNVISVAAQTTSFLRLESTFHCQCDWEQQIE